MLIKNVDELIKYLGRAVMSATTDDFIKPYIEEAQEAMIVKAFGEELITELDTQHNGGTVSVPNTKLLPKIQRALAWFAYLKYLPFSIGNDGDNGLQEVGTDSTQPVRIGVLDKRLRESEKNAVEALERALLFLETNRVDYATWTGSPAWAQYKSLFLWSATEMAKYLPSFGQNARLYLNVRPYIALAEQDYILPILGPAMFDELKGKVLSTMTANEKELLAHVQRALAFTAYAQALPDLNIVTLGNGNLRVLSDFDGIYNQKTPEPAQLKGFISSKRSEGQRLRNVLKRWLTVHADDFPTFKNSTAFSQPAVNKLPDNSGYTKVFRMR
ncbi:MAG: DUF6712 family protein [Spirosomataceae bacterium]